MSNTYDIGDEPNIKGAFTDDTPAAVNPSAVLLIVQKPDGTRVSYLSTTGFTSQGSWNASTNTPALANGTGTAGHYYTVSVGGTVDFGDGNITFTTSDYVYYNGDVWKKIPNPSATTLSNPATGTFQTPVHMSQVGEWFYRFEGIGTGQAAGEGSLRVRSSRVGVQP